ncbi:hypothetical protein JK358_00015 [Nocardia sp. 2]|uniref:Uncharacterized protein n=1 Tax=Nocardia acididurans TaxID=2802282 RepID=A0ABS1LWW8_9NOCA|nr:hypothetical protein [Nocardia acididurans]MBL1072772.1 hypothetical protein [Nocardia acididurans]
MTNPPQSGAGVPPQQPHNPQGHGFDPAAPPDGDPHPTLKLPPHTPAPRQQHPDQPGGNQPFAPPQAQQPFSQPQSGAPYAQPQGNQPFAPSYGSQPYPPPQGSQPFAPPQPPQGGRPFSPPSGPRNQQVPQGFSPQGGQSVPPPGQPWQSQQPHPGQPQFGQSQPAQSQFGQFQPGQPGQPGFGQQAVPQSAGAPHPQWGGQSPVPPGKPGWQSPLVLGGVAVALVLVVVIGLVVALGGGDDPAPAAATSANATQLVPATGAATTSSAPSSTKSTTKTTAPASTTPIPADAKPIVDAMPAALRQAVSPYFARTKAPGYTDDDSFTTSAEFAIASSDALVSGLLDRAKDPLVMAHISTDPSKLPSIWRSKFPNRLTEKGGKLIRFEEGSISGTVEYFNPDTKLYVAVTNMKDKASALAFIERAGL